MTNPSFDLGAGHVLRYVSWGPDRTLNPQYANQSDIPRVGAIIAHLTPGGAPCEGSIFFDLPGVRELFPNRHVWTVESWEPLTLSPSIRCTACQDHGYIRNGRWTLTP